MNSTLAKVFIVDDTETNLDILIEALGDDYDVSVAMDGERALGIVEEEQPDTAKHRSGICLLHSICTGTH